MYRWPYSCCSRLRHYACVSAPLLLIYINRSYFTRPFISPCTQCKRRRSWCFEWWLVVAFAHWDIWRGSLEYSHLAMIALYVPYSLLLFLFWQD
ncbi:hypothetical protein BDV32DRAFT_69818 [Aspergillus pseudonomiae]|nr:hypothetical protein BDV32DRAFT_69818 [Aspergillus pseudonomiae]